MSCIAYFTFGLFNFGRAWPAQGSRTHWFLSCRWWDGSVLAEPGQRKAVVCFGGGAVRFFATYVFQRGRLWVSRSLFGTSCLAWVLKGCPMTRVVLKKAVSSYIHFSLSGSRYWTDQVFFHGTAAIFTRDSLFASSALYEGLQLWYLVCLCGSAGEGLSPIYISHQSRVHFGFLVI